MSGNNYAGRIRQKGSHIASDIRGIGAVVKEAASDKMHSVENSASEKLTAFKDGASSMGRNTRNAVNRVVSGSPWKSMFVAAGLGAAAALVAGWMLRRE